MMGTSHRLVSIVVLLMLVACGFSRVQAQPLFYDGFEGPTLIEWSINGGGVIEFAPGSLSRDSEVRISPGGVPLLPDGMSLIGETVIIEIDDAPTIPPTIELPLPPGQDPAALTLFQVDPDGNTTILVTQFIASGEVAGSMARVSPQTSQPGGRLVAPLMRRERTEVGISDGVVNISAGIQGPRNLSVSGPNSSATYSLVSEVGSSGAASLLRSVIWSAYGNAVALVGTDGNQADIEARYRGSALVTAEFIDLRFGVNAFAQLDLRVTDPVNLDVQLVISERIVQPGQTVLGVLQIFSEEFCGAGETLPDIELSWGDGQTMAISDCFTLLDHEWSTAREEPFLLTVTVDGQEFAGQYIWVREQLLEVTLIAPSTIVAGPNPVSLQAVAEGGSEPYTYAWTQSPGQLIPAGQASEDFEFPIPGSYQLSVTVRDQSGIEATASALVIATGPPLTVTLELGADVLLVGWTVGLEVDPSGGALVVNGKLGEYTLVAVDWGDGSVDKPGLTTTDVFPAVLQNYSDPGTYTITALVHDATGHAAIAVTQVRVVDAADGYWIWTEDSPRVNPGGYPLSKTETAGIWKDSESGCSISSGTISADVENIRNIDENTSLWLYAGVDVTFDTPPPLIPVGEPLGPLDWKMNMGYDLENSATNGCPSFNARLLHNGINTPTSFINKNSCVAEAAGETEWLVQPTFNLPSSGANRIIKAQLLVSQGSVGWDGSLTCEIEWEYEFVPATP